jgi:hypothetical protein
VVEQSELAVVIKAKELCQYVVTITENSPKRFRFTFVSRMQNLALDVIESLFRANDVFVGPGGTQADWRERRGLQRRALTSARVRLYRADFEHRDSFAFPRALSGGFVAQGPRCRRPQEAGAARW